MAESASWVTVALHAIDSDPRTFVTLLLAFLLALTIWLFTKFIRIKFIESTTKVVNAAGSIETMGEETLAKQSKLIKDFEGKLDTFSTSISNINKATQDEIHKLQTELIDIRKAMGQLSKMNRTTGQAVEQYQERMSVMEKNFELILNSIRQKKGG